MEETINAVYENGYFIPLEPLKIQLEEGQIVRLIITKAEKDEQDKDSKKENNQD